MNKKGWVVWVLQIFLFLAVTFVITQYIIQETELEQSLKTFCEEHGYEDYEMGYGRIADAVCINIEEDMLEKIEVGKCKKEWCFIK